MILPPSVRILGAGPTGSLLAIALSMNGNDITVVDPKNPPNYFKNVFPMKTYYRLRFMLLKPGGYVEPHSDSQTTNPSFAINISLNNPDGCFLVTEKGTVPFDDKGSVFLFNNYYKHSVVNNSNEDRFHIILHGRWDDTNEEIQNTITQYGERTN